MSKYNISKTSRFLGISSELLRHYERLGLIEPERHENGYRIFDYRQIDKLQGIRRFRNMGFSLAEIDRLIGCAAYDEVGALLEKALGAPFDPTVYTDYLEKKYAELYGL